MKNPFDVDESLTHQQNYKRQKKGFYVVSPDTYKEQLASYEENYDDKFADCYKKYQGLIEPKIIAPFAANALRSIRELEKKFPHANKILEIIEAQLHLQLIGRKKIA